MKKKILFSIVFLAFSGLQIFAQQTIFTVFDQILFYDGYAGVVNFATPPGVIRHRNDLYAKKISDAELAAFGSILSIDVTIKASCDNYDRIGNVNLALVPKGATTYVPDNVQRIELARYITPFMNKNLLPDVVPYSFNVDNVARIFKDPSILAAYDIWIELQVFGVPYAANTQISGCAGRNDVFFGTLKFISDSNTNVNANEVLLPLNFQKNLNNYQAAATDVVGQTVRTINFNLPTAVNDAKFYLITSNHGANSGGEEYNRRFHYTYLDNNLILTYKPGEPTCEPYRVYNTQGNGIYGATPRSNAQWQSFSNWCPGAKIPIRVIALGNLSAGPHSFKINVPTAVFANGEGYFPVSLYLQGTSTILGVEDNFRDNSLFSFYPNPTSDFTKINTLEEVSSVQVYNLLGQKVWTGNSNQIDLRKAENGIYNVQVEFKTGKRLNQKIIKK